MMSHTLLNVMCIIFLRNLLTCDAARKYCAAFLHPDYEKCSLRKELSLPAETGTHVCTPDDVCNKAFNISVLDVLPYSKAYQLVTKMLTDCCQTCADFKVNVNFVNDANMNPQVADSSDFIFPLLATFSSSELYGLKFLPVLDASSAYYFTLQKPAMILDNLLETCSDFWPLLVIGLLMAVVAGFILWLAETWKNDAQFSRTFHVGLFDGFWWSFISMTTVGYGDKYPISLAGRLCSVVWVLIGVTIYSMFTASLTNALENAAVAVGMEGRVVGALKYRFHDVMMIAQHGGTFHPVESNNLTSGVYQLVRKVERGEIDGFLLDVHTYDHFYHNAQNKDLRRVLVEKMTRTEKFYDGEKLSFGVLMSNSVYYDYFRQYLQSNRLQIRTCFAFMMNYVNHDHLVIHSAFDVHNGHFFPFLYCLVGLLAAIFIFGFIYELARRKFSSKTADKTEPVINMNALPKNGSISFPVSVQEQPLN